MGLAQQMIRPRNRGYSLEVISDTLSITENGQYTNFGLTAFTAGTATKRTFWPHAIVCESVWFRLASNNLDALSVNAFVLENITGSVDAKTMVITDATGEFIQFLGDVSIPLNNSIALRWDSDSVGSIAIRAWGMRWRAVVLG